MIWICHDLKPHDWNAWHWQALWWATLRAMLLLSDSIIALSPGTREVVAQRYPAWIRGRLEWAWHPKYEDVLTDASTRIRTRESMSVGGTDRLVGFFGQIRLQKGVEDLIDAFSLIKEPDIHLMIAGAPWGLLYPSQKTFRPWPKTTAEFMQFFASWKTKNSGTWFQPATSVFSHTASTLIREQ